MGIKHLFYLLFSTVILVITQYSAGAEVLKGSVSAGDFPEEFIGTWKVINTLEETNNPDLFLTKSTDLWVFERIGDTISLSNPITGASASITIKQIDGKTAVFERAKQTEDYYETETAQVTVEEDSFFGTDTIIMYTYYKNGRRVNIKDVVKYNIRGYKISGTAIKELFKR